MSSLLQHFKSTKEMLFIDCSKNINIIVESEGSIGSPTVRSLARIQREVCPFSLSNEVIRDVAFLTMLHAASMITNDSCVYEKVTHKLIGAMIAPIHDWDSIPECMIVSEKFYRGLVKNILTEKIVSITNNKELPFAEVPIKFKPFFGRGNGFMGIIDCKFAEIKVISDFIFRKSIIKNSYLIGKHFGKIQERGDKYAFVVSKPQMVVESYKKEPIRFTHLEK